jgi:hypothetical protein
LSEIDRKIVENGGEELDRKSGASSMIANWSKLVRTWLKSGR